MRFLLVALIGLLVFLLSAGVQGQTTLAAGYYHFLQIKGNTVYGWGRNSSGQLGLGENTDKPTPQPVPLAPTQSGNPVSACAGNWHSCILDDENNLSCTGNDYFGQTGVGLSDVNTNLLGMPTGVSSVAHVGCGGSAVYVTTTTGALMTWGKNDDGQLGLAPATWGTKVREAQVSIFFS
jgi:alpha-tubulin suppressor-like RCC1 family protein